MEGRESELSDLDFRLMESANKALVKEEGWDLVPDPERFLFVILEGRLDSCMVASSLIKFSNFSMLVAITPVVGALQFTAMIPDFEVHFHNVQIVGVVGGHVFYQDGGETELSLTRGTRGHLGVVILA